jgi:ATP adenylyltransferase
MKFLSAPWRWDFISGSKKQVGCVFCNAQKLPDNESFICYRSENFFIILNRYPYNSGHLMIVPYAHVDSPAGISSGESEEMWELVNKSITVLARSFNPAGFNIGMNVGKAAGAGIKDHLHLHLVPRWEGDANFMPVIGKTEVASYDLTTIFDVLHKEFNR